MHPNRFLVLLRPEVWALAQVLQLEVQQLPLVQWAPLRAQQLEVLQQVLVRLTPVRALWLEVQQPRREED